VNLPFGVGRGIVLKVKGFIINKLPPRREERGRKPNYFTSKKRKRRGWFWGGKKKQSVIPLPTERGWNTIFPFLQRRESAKGKVSLGGEEPSSSMEKRGYNIEGKGMFS